MIISKLVRRLTIIVLLAGSCRYAYAQDVRTILTAQQHGALEDYECRLHEIMSCKDQEDLIQLKYDFVQDTSLHEYLMQNKGSLSISTHRDGFTINRLYSYKSHFAQELVSIYLDRKDLPSVEVFLPYLKDYTAIHFCGNGLITDELENLGYTARYLTLTGQYDAAIDTLMTVTPFGYYYQANRPATFLDEILIPLLKEKYTDQEIFSEIVNMIQTAKSMSDRYTMIQVNFFGKKMNHVPKPIAEAIMQFQNAEKNNTTYNTSNSHLDKSPLKKRNTALQVCLEKLMAHRLFAGLLE